MTCLIITFLHGTEKQSAPGLSLLYQFIVSSYRKAPPSATWLCWTRLMGTTRHREPPWPHTKLVFPSTKFWAIRPSCTTHCVQIAMHAKKNVTMQRIWHGRNSRYSCKWFSHIISLLFLCRLIFYLICLFTFMRIHEFCIWTILRNETLKSEGKNHPPISKKRIITSLNSTRWKKAKKQKQKNYKKIQQKCRTQKLNATYQCTEVPPCNSKSLITVPYDIYLFNL